MYKVLRADKDAYITNKVIKGTKSTKSNVGGAATLDLYKLYGATMSASQPNVELSRLLIHFDLDPLRDAIAEGLTSLNSPSLTCKLRLRDVYGGQPTPSNFQVSVFPLSSSFDEGPGRDVVYLSDLDACNWLSSSRGTEWLLQGCGLSGGQIGPSDYMTSSLSLASTESTQEFITGEEDLFVDVTPIVSATLAGEIPDSGFRISFKNALEENSQSYFVKRFGSRHAYNESKRPALLVGFDDSIKDDTQNLSFDVPCTLSLYNSAGGKYANILSGSSLSEVTGSNCLVLKLMTPVSGGSYDLIFTGSQFSRAPGAYVPGVYQSSVLISSSDPVIYSKLQNSSSIQFTPVWSSLDGTISYSTGSILRFYPPSRSSSRGSKNYVVNVLNLKDSYRTTERIAAKVHIFDYTNPLISVNKIPVEMPGIVVPNAYYQIRDSVTNEIEIPFDEVTSATKISSDGEGMFFRFDADALIPGRTYAVDVLIVHNGEKMKFGNASPVFRIDSNDDQT